MLMKTSFLAVFSVLLATGGQLLLRDGMESVGYIGVPRLSRPGALVFHIARTPQVVIGFTLFALSAATWLIVLSRAPLSFAYPFAGLTYVTITVFSRYALHEQIPVARWLGIALIVTGVLVVGRTAPPGID